MSQINLIPCVVCGPSGVGKGTLLKQIKKLLPNTFGVSVSHTTRKPRKGEIDGVNYHYITREEFTKGIENQKFIETKQYADNYYGTSHTAIQDVKQNNLICILEIHVSSAQFIKDRALIDANYLFITCNDENGDSSIDNKLDTLRQRLIKRNTEKPEQIEQRLKAAEEEFKFVEQNQDFFDCIISNDNLEESTAKLIQQFKTWYPWIDNDDNEAITITMSSYDGGLLSRVHGLIVVLCMLFILMVYVH